MSNKSKNQTLKSAVKGIDIDTLDPNPVVQFGHWFREADEAGIYLHNAMALATVDAAGNPSIRMMLLKEFKDKGFVFFTNYESRKANELDVNPRASILLHWSSQHRQVRINGLVEILPEKEAQAYFKTRPYGSQIGAWASRQSKELANRQELVDRVNECSSKYKKGHVPLPPFWGGYRLNPERIEFWQGRADRLHDRICYTLEKAEWRMSRLSP